MTPRVSVLMPVFNGGTFLDAAIDSVLAQSEADFELLAIDDGSTDRSAQMLSEIAARDDRVRLLRKPNSGISETLNVGLAKARAPWIARIDADDLMTPTRLERQLAFVEANPGLVAAGSYYELVDAQGETRGVRQPLPRTTSELARILAGRELLTFTHPTMIYRRDLALALGGYNKLLEPCEDTDLFAQMLSSGGLILIQPEILTRYRVHGGTVSSRKANEMFHKARFVSHNFYAAREGAQAIAYDEYRRQQCAMPFGERVKLRRDLVSDACYRAYTGALVGGRRLEALLWLTAGAALRPAKAVRRGLRTMPFRRWLPGAAAS